MACLDERALGILYDRHSAVVFGVAAQFVDEEDAREVLEDTFWQAWRQAEQYNDRRGTVAGWLITIARSRALDRRRKRQRSRVLDLKESDVTAADTGHAADCPLSQAISGDRRKRVLEAIGMLPQDQRETVMLSFFGGLSQSEIARQLEQPIGTVKTRARLAMTKLRGHLLLLRDTTT